MALPSKIYSSRPMAKLIKDHKSVRLRELEDVFERRTRRFSPFEVLGLTSEKKDEQLQEITASETAEEEAKTEDQPLQNMLDPNPPMGVANPPTPGPTRPTPGAGRPRPGMGRPTVVVDNIYTTTTEGPTHGSDPPTSAFREQIQPMGG